MRARQSVQLATLDPFNEVQTLARIHDQPQLGLKLPAAIGTRESLRDGKRVSCVLRRFRQGGACSRHGTDDSASDSSRTHAALSLALRVTVGSGTAVFGLGLYHSGALAACEQGDLILRRNEGIPAPARNAPCRNSRCVRLLSAVKRHCASASVASLWCRLAASCSGSGLSSELGAGPSG